MKTKTQPTVLIADDEADVRYVIKRFLLRQGYEPILAADGREAIGKSKVQNPDIVLLDVNMPNGDGFAVCKQLREDPSTRLTPVLMLTARGTIEDKVTALNIGADDYLLKPFDMTELQARIDVLLRRTQNMIAVNPLTRLPGGPSIQEEIERRIKLECPFAAAYIDLDNFKTYNDAYGYHQGDLVILWTARMIQNLITQGKGSVFQPHFLGHIGGDDFVLITEAGAIRDLAQAIADQFDGHRAMWYNVWDRLKGAIETKDRQGQLRRFPLMTLSIGVSTNEKRAIKHYGEVAQITSELKKFAKNRLEKEKSLVIFDRRTS